MKIGLLVIDEDPQDAIRVAQAADRAGVHSIWTIDYYNRSSMARAAAFAVATESALIGTSVTPLFARVPLATAAAATDIQGLSGGRFVLGVGTSTRRMNQDWYGVDLDHPASRLVDRIKVIRELMDHRTGAFSYSGPFDAVTMAHFDNTAAPEIKVPIFSAGVGERMIRAAGSVADGFVGHPIASVANLKDLARPGVEVGAASTGRSLETFTYVSQVIAAVSSDPKEARAHAAQQVGFYSTVRGYDVLFPDGQDSQARVAAREAFAMGDYRGVARAADAFVDERAVFGSSDDVRRELARYEPVIDWALLYSPHYGVSSSQVTKNELALIDIASDWK